MRPLGQKPLLTGKIARLSPIDAFTFSDGYTTIIKNMPFRGMAPKGARSKRKQVQI